MTAKVRLVQLLCPNRHCVFASAYLPGESTFAAISAHIRRRMTELGANWRCGLCESVDLRFEDAETRYNSLEEALPHLARTQAKQLHTRKVIAEQRKRARN